jgi:peptide chain release factor 1
MSLDEKLDKIVEKYKKLQDKLALGENIGGKEYIEMTKELSDLGDVVEKINDYQKTKRELLDLQDILSDSSNDKDFIKVAEEELHVLKIQLPKKEKQLKLALIPKDKADSKNAIIEIRAGTGGDEAALFAAELFYMYQRYASKMGWKLEILSSSESEIGGFKEISMVVSGNNVFSRLKFESGVHRVQRIPETESSGRVHTSAATVAILPEAEEVDIELQDKDLRIDVFRASGAGGQHVNTTDSAVRIVHIPTGIMVQQQDEKSQHKNKAKALKILRSRLYDHERQKQMLEIAQSRKEQVGSGDRSERIRTYNFPQGRVTDHRINLTLYKIEEIVKEGNLDELIEALIADDEAKKLSMDT